MTTIAKLRVWYWNGGLLDIRHYFVESPGTAIQLIDLLAWSDLHDKNITTNAFGLEEWDGFEWSEWYSDEGDDIHEYAEYLKEDE